MHAIAEDGGFSSHQRQLAVEALLWMQVLPAAKPPPLTPHMLMRWMSEGVCCCMRGLGRSRVQGWRGGHLWQAASWDRALHTRECRRGPLRLTKGCLRTCS